MGKIDNLIKVMFLILFLVLALTTISVALDYPQNPIQIIVPAPPGGAMDLFARILAPNLTSNLGQPVMVVNKPGAGAAIGTKFVSTAKPDGYTILVNHRGILFTPILSPDIGFELKDFIPFCRAASVLTVIVVNTDSPWKSLRDFITEAKKNPGKLTYGSAGFGTSYHFYGELFKIETATDIVHVPLAGEAGSITGLLGGHIDMSLTGFSAARPYLKAGTLRALALMYQKRVKDFPDIPTTDELGYPSLTTVGWYGFFLPAKTPREIVEKLAKVFETALKDAEVIKNIENVGMLVEVLTMDEATKFFQYEEKKWREVAKKAKIAVEVRK